MTAPESVPSLASPCEPHPGCLYEVARLYPNGDEDDLASQATLRDVTLAVKADAQAQGLTLPDPLPWQGHMNAVGVICFYLADAGPLAYLAIPRR